MSDREKKEQEIMNQEMSTDEMENLAGGRIEPCWHLQERTECKWATAKKYGRRITNPDGSTNCAATVEDGSWCGTNDACYDDQVIYMDLHDCAKAWK